MPTKQQDHYGALGVDRAASAEDIRKAYRRLARKHHPDLNPGDKAAEERFKKVQEAYDILSDTKKKQMFDQFGFYSENGMPQGAPGGGAGPNMGFGGFDFTDFANQQQARGRGEHTEDPGGGFGGFRDIFSQMFGGGRQRAQEAEKGADLEYALNIDFWAAIRGTQVKVGVTRQESCGTCGGSGSAGGNSTICSECNGSGNVTQMAGAMKFSLNCPRCNGTGRLKNSCPACHGEGRTAKTESVDIRIPPGAQTGSRLRVAGKGNAGSMGATAGDLYITIRVDPHPVFTRNGDDIEISIPVRVDEAGLGTKIEVPTIDGKALLKIPQGTQNGQKLRLRDKGVQNSRRGTRGDQIVEIVLLTPDTANERTRELLRELAKTDPTDPRADMWAKVGG